MRSYIRQIEYFLPQHVLANADLAAQFPEWSVDKISSKTGIYKRHIAAENECSSDLAVGACTKLFGTGTCTSDVFDFIILCTQSPDYFLPTTACLLQTRLGLREDCGAFDFNLGCSGFVYGLGLAKGLIETGQARNVLLVTAETYSKFLRPDDKSVRTIFGDAAAATWVASVDTAAGQPDPIGPFVYGTDGKGAENLIVKLGGVRTGYLQAEPGTAETRAQRLHMNGPEIFNFTLKVVPDSMTKLMAASGLTSDAIDYYVMHQANRYMLEHLRDKLGIPPEKFIINMENCGNTVSSTIPIALRDAQEAGTLKNGNTLALVGFGVGYSWGAVLVRWRYGA
jgi:3-oxoacyl-[acyl-carrier-protein] synthase-3